MHQLFYTSIHMHRKCLENLYKVDFVGTTTLDDAHDKWWKQTNGGDDGITYFRNLDHQHKFRGAETADKFLCRIRECTKEKEAMRSFARDFFHLEDSDFKANKWIRLKLKDQKEEEQFEDIKFVTPPPRKKDKVLQLNVETKGIIWIFGLPFEHNKPFNRSENFTLNHVTVKESSINHYKSLKLKLKHIWESDSKAETIQADEISLRYYYGWHETFSDRIVATCSFADCSRFQLQTNTPMLVEEVEEEVEVPSEEESEGVAAPSNEGERQNKRIVKKIKNFHCTGDWNNLDFYYKMMDWNKMWDEETMGAKSLEGNPQCNVIVFQPVWLRKQHDDQATQREIQNKIGEMYEDRFRDYFFDNFFRFIATHRCLKENGTIVLPFHPRMIAGLFRCDSLATKVEVVDSVGVLKQAEGHWQDELTLHNAGSTNGFVHKFSTIDDFNDQLEKQANKLGVAFQDLKDFCKQKAKSEDNKPRFAHMVIKGKGLYEWCPSRSKKKEKEIDDKDLIPEQEAEQKDDGEGKMFDGEFTISGDDKSDGFTVETPTGIKVKMNIDNQNKVQLNIYLKKKITLNHQGENLECECVKVFEGDDDDETSMDFAFDENTNSYQSPLRKRPRIDGDPNQNSKVDKAGLKEVAKNLVHDYSKC